MSDQQAPLPNLPAEFQQLPLHAIIAEPLMAVVDGQTKSALATQAFIQSFLQPAASGGGNAPQAMNVTFSTSIVNPQNSAEPTAVTVTAPLLSIVPIPNLRIDSLSVSFKYEVSQVIASSTSKTDTASGTLGAKIGLASWGANLSLSGSVTSDSKQSSTTNRSGVLDIEMHASEAPMPEGLAKILSILSNAITVTPATNSGGQGNQTQPQVGQGTSTGTTGTGATGTGTTGTGTTGTGTTGTGTGG